MTDEQFEIIRQMLADALQRLERLERQRLPPEPTHANDLVDADYFARVTSLSPATILGGGARTDAVPRQSKRPSRWRKADVDKFQRDRAAGLRSPKQKALRLLEKRRT